MRVSDAVGQLPRTRVNKAASVSVYTGGCLFGARRRKNEICWDNRRAPKRHTMAAESENRLRETVPSSPGGCFPRIAQPPASKTCAASLPVMWGLLEFLDFPYAVSYRLQRCQTKPGLATLAHARLPDAALATQRPACMRKRAYPSPHDGGGCSVLKPDPFGLYNIQYRCGRSQIHHQAAPSRAQAAGAALVGGS